MPLVILPLVLLLFSDPIKASDGDTKDSVSATRYLAVNTGNNSGYNFTTSHESVTASKPSSPENVEIINENCLSHYVQIK